MSAKCPEEKDRRVTHRNVQIAIFKIKVILTYEDQIFAWISDIYNHNQRSTTT